MTMDIEQEIIKIKQRNEKVEADKAWETSLTRKILLLILTYILVYILMIVINIQAPHVNALIPTLGFFLSTLTLKAIKNIWLKKAYKK